MLNEFINVLLLLFSVYGLAMAAGVVSERSGIVNIGINANIIAGALGALIVHGLANKAGLISVHGNMGIDFAGIIVSGLAGVIISFLFSVATVSLKGDHVIVGTALNLLLPAISFVVFVLDKTNSFTVGDYDNKNGSIVLAKAAIGAFDWRNLIYLFVSIIFIALTWVGIRYTKFGLRVWASGENPHALAAAGVNVHRTRYFAQMYSGLLAGIAGASFLKYNNGLFSGDVDGIGFIAIALIVIGQWRIHWGVFATIVFVAIQSSLQAYEINIIQKIGAGSKYFMEAIPFVIPIIALPFFKKFSNMPRHDGLIYDPSQR